MSGGGDKTEKPTPKRRRESRKKGQIARTPDLGQWLTVLLLSVAIGPLLGHQLTVWRELFSACFRAVASPEPAKAMDLFGSALRQAFLAIVTLGSLVMVVGVVSSVAQGAAAPPGSVAGGVPPHCSTRAEVVNSPDSSGRSPPATGIDHSPVTS